MRIWKQLRTLARNMGIALVVGSAGLPVGTPAGQPDHGISGGAALPEAYSAMPLLSAHLQRMMQPVSLHREPFALPASDASAFYAAKWRELSLAIERDRNVLGGCRREPERCTPEARRLLAIVDAARVKEGRARLGEINRSLNLAIRYRSDIVQHATPDEWTSPLATLSSGAGDCEDYAIAKYLALRETGIPPGDLRFILVRNTRLQQDHAVLAARLIDRWLILDNRTHILVDDYDTRDYVPLTAFGPRIDPVLIATGRPEEAQNSTLPFAAEPARLEPGQS